MSLVKGPAPDHLPALLGLLLDDFREDLRQVGDERARGGPAVDDARALRSSQLRLLSLTPPDGMRVTDLAERVGMTKQALGEFGTALEDAGFLESVRDPADRRVRILRPTARGRAAVGAADEMIREVESRWRQRLGPRSWQRLRALLVESHTVHQARRDSRGAPPRG